MTYDLRHLGEFRTIVADPPWLPARQRNTPDLAGHQTRYPVMPLEEIASIIIPAAARCHLYLWVLNQHVDFGHHVARAWGFEPLQMFTWCKGSPGAGNFRCNSESFLVCRKGPKDGNGFRPGCGTWFKWPRREHSRKPDQMFELVESLSPGPYLEMFARRPRPGWTVWGNEVGENARVASDDPVEVL